MTAQPSEVTAMPVDWLLEADQPWVRFWTLRDLLGRPADEPDVVAAHRDTLAYPGVRAILAGLADWPGEALNRHNDAGHPLHKLSLLADLGLTAADPDLAPILDRVLANQSPEGPFTVNLRVNERFGGDGQDHPGWMACDAPTVLAALLDFGLGDDPRVRRALDHLLGLAEDNGWRCVVAEVMGGFRGPGRHDDACPYATLIALRAIGRVPALLESGPAQRGIAALLHLWDIQRERKPYLFGIGTDFRKPKYPLVWYDLLHMVDVLSRFPKARSDPRFQAMLGELMVQSDETGRFTARSMYQAWKGWDFADKKTPSPTITAVAWRAFRRAQGNS